jgi:hypothetical protein
LTTVFAPAATTASPIPPKRAKRLLAPPKYLPEPPRRLEDIDIAENLLTDIAVRHVNARGVLTIHLLAKLMRLPLEFTEALFRRLRDEQYLEVRRSVGDDYVFSLSPNGRKMAAERALSSRYTGPAPVSLKEWTKAVRIQAARTDITLEKLRRAFTDIVVEDKFLDTLGPALISRNAIFLYGPAGTGKTTIAERLGRVFEDAVVVPWAVEVDGQVIMVADPALHQELERADLDLGAGPEAGNEAGNGARNDAGLDLDPRWVVCRRPFVAVGGELVTGMLDLQKDESSGAWSAPLQMKANNGILLVDDFGRQMISPRDLLNRWIVPLDRRIDFLSLGSGGKFTIPFEIQIVFSTNLAPHELADEAFLRRIPNKIFVDATNAAQFDQIFRQTCTAVGMTWEPGSEEYLRELCLRHSPDLRPCFPRDFCNAIRAITIYEHRQPAITRRDLERAAAVYFV